MITIIQNDMSCNQTHHSSILPFFSMKTPGMEVFLDRNSEFEDVYQNLYYFH